jgi:drug/metabolite transporter (DMT)-like permease
MHFPAHLFIPLVCGFVYVMGAMCLKQAAAQGSGVWRSTFVANLTMAIGFSPLILLGGTSHPLVDYWQPALTGLLFTIAQLMIYLAISHGDVSVTTPVMGTKSILVAVIASMLFAVKIPASWWWAAGLCAVAVLLLGWNGGTPHRRVGLTIALTTGSATIYAFSDVLTQHWAPAWGPGRFLPIMFGTMGLLSFGFIPFFNGSLRTISRPAWKWLAPGALLLAVNNAAFAFTLAQWHDATAANIVYSSRGLWSVVVVWAFGHWFGNQERHAGRGAMLSRLAGAGLMVAAIVLVVT